MILVEKNASYVVFMQDTDKKIQSHTGILVVNADGTAYMRDNSSGNNAVLNEDGSTTYNGGTEYTKGQNAKSVCESYDNNYDTWYFQKKQ